MLLNKIDPEQIEILKRKIKPTSDVFISKYFRVLKLNRIQYTRRKVGAGRNYAVHPSGTNRGQSRLPRVVVPGKGNIPKARPMVKGGPRGYHDAMFKILLKLNKKERKLAITQILIRALTYTHTFIVNDIELKNRSAILNEIKLYNEDKYTKKIKRVYRKLPKVCVLLHDNPSIDTMYRNTKVDLVNIKTPNYMPLELLPNSNHLVLISKTTFNELINERI